MFLGVLIDDFSRFAVGWALDDAERADAVIASFEAAVARYGRPEAIMQNGKSEVFNANLQKECFDRVIFTDVGDLRRRIAPPTR